MADSTSKNGKKITLKQWLAIIGTATALIGAVPPIISILHGGPSIANNGSGNTIITGGSISSNNSNTTNISNIFLDSWSHGVRSIFGINSDEKKLKQVKNLPKSEPAHSSLVTTSATDPKPYAAPAKVTCDDNLKRGATKRLAEMQATRSLSYQVDPYPCPRELTLYLSGKAISTKPSGARTAEFSVSDSSRELCKAAASAATWAGENVEFTTSRSTCKMYVAPYEKLTLAADVKSISKSDPLSISLTIDAVGK
ncbi:hypothetical protein LQR31_19650 [Chromobacterium vaccinii]|uniref:hypothetical protein n=1 Tax=Chromobacterium vaccinii TaxID=1108595 RepID=UPI001E411D3F|nr:hypothetical protein [Chromobacterium vaccinii]MCD4486695.1 hypothetical protein [Chromobacterium vaccinii]